jgi:hypothetical protein
MKLRRPFRTLNAFHNKAQGREAHPGTRRQATQPNVPLMIVIAVAQVLLSSKVMNAFGRRR